MFVLEVLNKNLEHNSKPTLNSLFRMALITGSGRGIGKKTAILLSKKGFNLIISSRNQNEIDSVVNEIK